MPKIDFISMDERYADIDPSSLNDIEKLGLAYCVLNTGKSVTIRIDGTDIQLRGIESMRAIGAIIGKSGTSLAWWRFELKKSSSEWLIWWLTQKSL